MIKYVVACAPDVFDHGSSMTTSTKHSQQVRQRSQAGRRGIDDIFLVAELDFVADECFVEMRLPFGSAISKVSP